ncbi:type II toxin-antitoxin system HicB family antitoxin [Chthonobacter albigriseus]|uniref:type II toxin-antitoxin system HicB family antitoxin n=1 Tax=Chthonobacter albigriseus TaxID=1683161 RepID=UPI0015EEA633|nr:type II toxin-antitoxin system HicB family antitoxin [Chthonobacter albigriseus]
MTLQYPIVLTPDDDGSLLVTCPVLPELTTFGADQSEAVRQAEAALEEAVSARIAAWEQLPLSSGRLGGLCIRLSLQSTLKALLYIACREEKVTRAELVRRLGWHREQVDRLFRLDHASRIDQIEAAFGALGRHVEVEVAA